jgi:hypothetical protein
VDGEIEEEVPEIEGLPTKLSDKIIAGIEDDDIEMMVLRRTKGRKTAFLFELDEYEDMPALLNKLRDEYGGGDFVIEGKRANGQWAFKQSLTVEKPHKEEPKTEHNANGFEAVLLAMQESAARASQETRDLMVTLQTQQMNAAQDNMKMIVEMMKVNSDNKETFSMKDMVETLVALKGLDPKEPDNPMDLFFKGMEMGKEVSNNPDESVLQTAVKTLGAPLAQMAQMTQQGGLPAPASPSIEPTQESSLPGNTTETSQSTEQEPDMLAQFQPYLQMLANAAVQGADPEVYANLLMDQLPKEVLAFIEEEQKYSQLFLIMPQLVPYRVWFDDCRALLLQFIAEENAANETPPHVPSASETTDLSPAPAPVAAENTEDTPPDTPSA